MLLGTLGTSLLGNLSTGKGIARAGSCNPSKKGKGIVRAGYGDHSQNKISMYLRVAFDSFAVRFTFIFSECLFACL